MKSNKKQLKWVWQKVPIELTKLEDGQLYAIRDALVNSKKKVWFNVNSKVWLKEVNYLIKKKEHKNTEEISNHIVQRRLRKSLPRAQRNADIIAKAIEKIMNKK